MSKIFGITVLLFGLLVVIATYEDVSPWLFDQTQAEQIQSHWKQDIELLVRYKSLPKEWTQVTEIQYFPLTDSAKDLLKKIRPPLGNHKDGNYRMEVTIDDWVDKENGNSNYGLMIQYQIFDKVSQNLVWELGRTLTLKPTENSAQIPSHDKSK